MNGNVPRPGARRHRRVRALRRRLVVGLIGLLPLATGCQTLRQWPDSKSGQSSATSTSTSNASSSGATTALGDKTEFHKTVGPEQQYNVHMELGRAFETEGHHEAAIAEYQKALDASGHMTAVHAGAKSAGARQAKAHRRIGAAYDRLGRFVLAETHYRAALKASPDDPRVWNDAGYSYYLQRRWDDAERCLKTAQSIDPENFQISTNLGLALAANGKPDEALISLSRAGGPAIGHANLGYLLAALGKTEEARRHYQVAVEMQPDLAAARQALASLDATALGETRIADGGRPAPASQTPAQREPGVALASSEVKPNEPDAPIPTIPVATTAAPAPAPAPAPFDRQAPAPSPLAALPPSSPLLDDPVPSDLILSNPATPAPTATETTVASPTATGLSVLPPEIPEIPGASPAANSLPPLPDGHAEKTPIPPTSKLPGGGPSAVAPSPANQKSPLRIHTHTALPTGTVNAARSDLDLGALPPLPAPIPRASTPPRPGPTPIPPPRDARPPRPVAPPPAPQSNADPKVIPLTVFPSPG